MGEKIQPALNFERVAAPISECAFWFIQNSESKIQMNQTMFGTSANAFCVFHIWGTKEMNFAERFVAPFALI